MVKLTTAVPDWNPKMRKLNETNVSKQGTIIKRAKVGL